MDKNKDDIILYHQKKRKKRKIKLAIATILLILIALILIGTYFVLNKDYFINYKETSKLKYGVNLIDNEFYKENYLEKDVNVIANLIKNMDLQFKYNLDLQEEIEYKYSYKIIAQTEVKEKSKSNVIYETEKELINKPVQEGKGKKIEILEKLNLNYNEFNNQINKLLEQYKLSNTTSDLSISLYLDVINKATGERINKEYNVMSVVMPLTTKTVEITINENIKDYNGKLLIKESPYENLEYCLIIGIIVLIIGIIVLIKLIKYISDTRSAEKMYDDELRKILFDYKSYIQKINNKVDMNAYKIIEIDTFKDLLGMREEMQSPILMYTEDKKDKTTFMIMNENILFIYVLEAKLIRKKLIEKSKQKEEKKNEQNK